MNETFSKKTSKGILTVSVREGTAIGSLDGRPLGTTGILTVSANPITCSDGTVFTAGIFGFGLTASEAATIREMLSARSPVEASRGKGRPITFTAEVRASGDIKKFRTV